MKPKLTMLTLIITNISTMKIEEHTTPSIEATEGPPKPIVIKTFLPENSNLSASDLLDKFRNPQIHPKDTTADPSYIESQSAKEEDVRLALLPNRDIFSEIDKKNLDSLHREFESSNCSRRGLTLTSVKPFAPFGLGKMGCVSCDPYDGDTICWEERSILCINPSKLPRPPYPQEENYNTHSDGWSGGYIAITPPVRGCYITSEWHADTLCKREFGSCWRMARFDDGWYLKGEENKAYCEWDWNSDNMRKGSWAFWGYGDGRVNLNEGRF